MHPRTIVTALALSALIVLSCDEYPVEDETGDGGPKLSIAVASGNGQTERVGAYLPESIVVKVSDAQGGAKSGVSVYFNTSSPGAVVTPSVCSTDAAGLASCHFKLGTTAGTQHALAFMQDDSVTITATADAVLCGDEAPSTVCRADPRIAISTTSSSLLSLDTGSVILEFDPATQQISKVLETTERIDGLAFSPKGVLFATALHKIFKVNTTSGALENYILYNEDWHLSIEPNKGGVLAGVCEGGPLSIGCPPNGFKILLPPHVFPSLQWENVAVDAATRDVFVIDRFRESNFKIWRIYWDGRTSVRTFDVHADLVVGDAEPRGMCTDSLGTIYITFDGSGDYRRIVSVAPDGAIDYDFFDFLAHAGGDTVAAGRWGDIAYLNGKLYLIDTRNDRLVVISKDGEWLEELADAAFSARLDEREHYAISASRVSSCGAVR